VRDVARNQPGAIMRNSQDLKVFISTGTATCGECTQALGRSAWICLAGERGALCLACADLDHLVFLASGDAALTRRARKHSTLSAIVLKWSRSRNRYERQGVLIEEAGLAQAEGECLADAEARECRRQREALRRTDLDREYVERFAHRVSELFPSCPSDARHVIAEHACLKYSGRVGRSAAAKDLDEAAVRSAVVAHVRHVETPHDRLLAAGNDRHEARRQVESQVDAALSRWQRSAPRPA
jgi:hypothetical protein